MRYDNDIYLVITMTFKRQYSFCKKLFGFLLFVIFVPSPLYADSPLLITSGRGEPFVKPDNTGFYDLIVKTMFNRVGVNAKTILLPSERSLLSANTGIDDGNIARIKGIEKKYKNLVMVPEKIIDFEFVVFTRNNTIQANNWDDLRSYNVAFITGWKFFEKRVKAYISLVKVKDSTQLFGLLNHDRVDIALYDLWSGLWQVKHFQDSGVLYLKPPLARVKLYLYLNKKHRQLVPGLAKALKAMKQDGTYSLIYNQSLNVLLE